MKRSKVAAFNLGWAMKLSGGEVHHPIVATTKKDFFYASVNLPEGDESPVVLKHSRKEYADGSLEAMRELYRQKNREATIPIDIDDLRELYREFDPNSLVVIVPSDSPLFEGRHIGGIVTNKARLKRFQLASLDNPLNFYLCKRLSVEERNLLHKEEQGLYMLARGGTPNGNG